MNEREDKNMSKKDRMLNHISNNVEWFLVTDASVEVIPYYNMTNSVFSRAKEYLVDGYVDFDDVVCLVSTSILEPGKSGILFTTDAMYCKSWGLLTTKYRNYYFSYEFSEFDFHNDFYEDRMKELMKDLNDISVDEYEIEQFNEKIIDMGKKVGVAALGSMAVLDIITSIGDSVVSKNNDKIANEIAKLESSNNEETVNAITIYNEFIPLMNQFVGVCEKAENEDDGISEQTLYELISLLNDLLLALYNQTIQNIDVSPDDEKEYAKFGDWLGFWALMFYDGDRFREAYPISLLEEMPECWEAVIRLMDEVLEDEWDESFSSIVYEFAEKVISNSTQMSELMSSSEWEDDFVEVMGEIIELNNQAVESLEDALDRATDYLVDLLHNSEDE